MRERPATRRRTGPSISKPCGNSSPEPMRQATERAPDGCLRHREMRKAVAGTAKAQTVHATIWLRRWLCSPGKRNRVGHLSAARDCAQRAFGGSRLIQEGTFHSPAGAVSSTVVRRPANTGRHDLQRLTSRRFAPSCPVAFSLLALLFFTAKRFFSIRCVVRFCGATARVFSNQRTANVARRLVSRVLRGRLPGSWCCCSA